MTEIKSLKLDVGSTPVSAEVLVPNAMKCFFTFAHGAGANMHHVFMKEVAEALAERGIGTLRFNFPFMEGRKGRPDVSAVAHKAVESALHKAHELYPDVPLYAAGKSFGGRMSSQFLAKHHPDFVNGLIFFGFPLHPPGKPSVERGEHLKDVKVPMLFLQGTRDELAQWDLIEQTCSALPLATLTKIEGADHAFKIPRQKSVPLLCDRVEEWVARQ
ncbi:MAG: alpha/beta fold hydrolase [Bacteroidota bacterium]